MFYTVRNNSLCLRLFLELGILDLFLGYNYNVFSLHELFSKVPADNTLTSTYQRTSRLSQGMSQSQECFRQLDLLRVSLKMGMAW